MELNIATLTAPTLAAPADLLSLLQAPEGAPAVSTDSSASVAQDFSAMLTEMIGPVATPQIQVPALPEVQPAPKVELPALPEIAVTETKVKEPQKAPKVEGVLPGVEPEPFVLASLVPAALLAAGVKPTPASLSADGTPDLTEAAPEPAGAGFMPAPTNPRPELDRAFAELRKFEVIVEAEPVVTPEAKPLAPTLEAKLLAPAPEARPLAATPAPVAEQKPLALVTTDPIAAVKQQQLPPRVMPIQKVMLDIKLPERTKGSASTSSSETTTTTTTQTANFTDPDRSVQPAEQARAAHQVEIPNMPKLQTVRTVSMQVGDGGSQVTIRIQERGGDVTMHLNTGNEPLHQDLRESVGSLVDALKQEHIQVSNVEVSKKPPIDKVRRMKEAR